MVRQLALAMYAEALDLAAVFRPLVGRDLLAAEVAANNKCL